jgi:hypothetical protein
VPFLRTSGDDGGSHHASSVRRLGRSLEPSSDVFRVSQDEVATRVSRRYATEAGRLIDDRLVTRGRWHRMH